MLIGRSRRDRWIEHTWNDSKLYLIQAPIYAFLHSSMSQNSIECDLIWKHHRWHPQGPWLFGPARSFEQGWPISMVLGDVNTDSVKYYIPYLPQKDLNLSMTVTLFPRPTLPFFYLLFFFNSLIFLEMLRHTPMFVYVFQMLSHMSYLWSEM